MVLRKGGTPQCARGWLNPCLSVSACGNCPGIITGHASSCKLVLHEEPRTQMLQSMPPRQHVFSILALSAYMQLVPVPPSIPSLPAACPALLPLSAYLQLVPSPYCLFPTCNPSPQRPGQLQLVPSPSPLWPTAAWSLSLPCIPHLQIVPVLPLYGLLQLAPSPFHLSPTCRLFPVPPSIPYLQLVPSPSPPFPTCSLSRVRRALPSISWTCVQTDVGVKGPSEVTGAHTCAGKQPTTECRQAVMAVTSAIGTHAVSHSL